MINTAAGQCGECGEPLTRPGLTARCRRKHQAMPEPIRPTEPAQQLALFDLDQTPAQTPSKLPGNSPRVSETPRRNHEHNN